MINKFLDALKKSANRTFTENGAVTLRSSGADVLDLFAVIGALRNAADEEREQHLSLWRDAQMPTLRKAPGAWEPE